MEGSENENFVGVMIWVHFLKEGRARIWSHESKVSWGEGSGAGFMTLA
jgi:hypothetical protein